MNIAIITGASSGIGLEYLRQISAAGGMDEIWAIARREDRLKQLSALVATPIRQLALDLTNPADMEELQRQLSGGNKHKNIHGENGHAQGTDEESDSHINVKMLVNAAGFGKMGDYSQVSDRAAADMIALNCGAAVVLSNLALRHMHKGAAIIQVCSSSAFQPLPGMNVYAASKAFLLSYSRGLRFELFQRGINVTAVCPYWVKDTEFISIARKSRNAGAVRHFPLASKKRDVVRKSLRDCRCGLAVSTPGAVPTAQRLLAKLLPGYLSIAAWELIRRL